MLFTFHPLHLSSFPSCIFLRLFLLLAFPVVLYIFRHLHHLLLLSNMCTVSRLQGQHQSLSPSRRCLLISIVVAWKRTVLQKSGRLPVMETRILYAIVSNILFWMSRQKGVISVPTIPRTAALPG